MSAILIGTDSGVFQLGHSQQDTQHEIGSPTVSFLVSAQRTAYALSQQGAFWVRTKSGNWQKVNEQPVSEEVWSLAVNPVQPQHLFLGVSPALLYESVDGGQTWKPIESIRQIPGYETWTFPPPPHIPHVRSIAFDPQVEGAIYIGVEEGGIYRSDNQGKTWESLNEGLYWDIHVVLPSPDSKHLYATTGKGFYRSDDGGQHWQHLVQGLERRYTIPCIALPTQPERVYTAAAAGPPPTWSRGANAAIYRSDDGGEHWVQLRQGLPEQFDEMVRFLTIDEAGGIWAATGGEVFQSSDAGESWQQVAQGLPTVRSLAIV